MQLLKHECKEPSPNSPLLKVVSENNIWQVGVYPTDKGLNIRCDRIETSSPVISYFVLGDGIRQLQIFMAVCEIINQLPEEITAPEVYNLLKVYEITSTGSDIPLKQIISFIEHLKNNRKVS